MGANIEYSVCSVCGNKAAYAHEYCDHIKKRKGSLVIIPANQLRDLLSAEVLRPEWLPSICASAFDVNELINGLSNKGIAARGFEINHILSFFELSVVAVPAYPEAYALEKIASTVSMDPLDHIKQLEQQYGKAYVYNMYNVLKEREYAV